MFGGSLTPSIALFPSFYEEGNDDDDIMSLPARLRKLSNPFPESNGMSDKYFTNGHSQERLLSQDEDGSQNGHSMPNGHALSSRKNPEVRSFRSLKNSYSSRTPLRRARSDAVERRQTQKALATSEYNGAPSSPSLLAKSLVDRPAGQDSHSWLLPSPGPSPGLPRKEEKKESNTLNIFGTLPRHRKKSVNQADCNKR